MGVSLRLRVTSMKWPLVIMIILIIISNKLSNKMTFNLSLLRMTEKLSSHFYFYYYRFSVTMSTQWLKREYKRERRRDKRDFLSLLSLSVYHFLLSSINTHEWVAHRWFWFLIWRRDLWYNVNLKLLSRECEEEAGTKDFIPHP